MIAVDIKVDSSIKEILVAKSCEYVLSLLQTFAFYHSRKPFYHYTKWLLLHTKIRYAPWMVMIASARTRSKEKLC